MMLRATYRSVAPVVHSFAKYFASSANKIPSLRSARRSGAMMHSTAVKYGERQDRLTKGNVGSNPASSREQLASKKDLLGALEKEALYETEAYQPPTAGYQALEKTYWKLNREPGDVNMSLVRKAGNMDVSVDFQLSPPLQEEEVNDDTNGSPSPGREGDMTNFIVTATNKNGAGVRFYCSTIKGDNKYRFLIANIKVFTDEKERDSETAYNGPDFQDLDDAMQHTIDAWVADLGVNNELCEIIEELSTDKEQQEYMKWIRDFIKVLEPE